MVKMIIQQQGLLKQPAAYSNDEQKSFETEESAERVETSVLFTALNEVARVLFSNVS